MAKLKSFQFELMGEKLSVPVRVNVKGEFIADIPDLVSQALNIRKQLIRSKLSELEIEFHAALQRYRDSTVTDELLIAISYKALGWYTRHADGSFMFGGYKHKYHLDINTWNAIDLLGFSFSVIIKRTRDGVTNYYNTDVIGQPNTILRPEFLTITHPASAYESSGRKFTHSDNCKMIPYSEIAYKTLTNAREKIRAASELLYNFIEQDEEQILLTLTNQNLLT